MKSERWLQIHIVGLCWLGSLFIALSTQDLLMPAMVLLAGVTAVLVTDTWKWFRLHRMLGNLAAVGAVFFSLQNFLNSNSDSQLLAIANLLVYLQIILFFQEKNVRLYWQVMLLSLLQVVVGAALNLGIKFGVLLLLYTILSVSTMVIFFVQRVSEEHTQVPPKAAPKRRPGPWQTLLGSPAAVITTLGVDAVDRRLLVPALAGQTLMLVLGAMLFGAVFFYAAPRHREAVWSGSRSFTRNETGFSREMELQQMGELLQSDTMVMRVALTNASGQPLPRFDPYFSGEALTFYHNDGPHARWLVSGPSNQGLFTDGLPAHKISQRPGLVYQHTEMRETSHPTLFTITPGYAIANSTPDDVLIDPITRLMVRRSSSGLPAQPFEFDIATTGIVQGQQARLTPRTPRYRNMSDQDLEECIVFDEVRFPDIKTLAAEIIERNGMVGSKPALRARAIEDYFLTPGKYTYSLNLNVPRRAGVDPIEDFAVNHHTGHCQYFASAMVMMLRSQKIPARMIVGYRGDEYNELSKDYRVRQRHAHAWVEAYIAQDEIPEYEAAGGEIGKHGAWYRLDPTPGQDEAAGQTATSWMGSARDWLDYVDSLWTDYVVGLDQGRQSRSIYGKMQNDAEEAPWLVTADWSETFRSLAAWFGFHFSKEGWTVEFDWRASMSAMALCVLAAGLLRLVRWLGLRFDWFKWNRRDVRRKISPVAFYARLENILAHRGRPRRLNETAREFIDHVVRELALPRGDVLAGVIDAFYRVRFGGATLDSTEAETIDNALTELERARIGPVVAV